ncbi:hypothetical protein D9611_011026 [Ephemerocybe angulata]|uniref:C2H2-type domain-containing protein n=1 Tax=Ephemerocybe angulata TaxID=980116 RepID=A0A8H5BB65_9AGAR|nr:hypothetical protein D9611_011026 [Tulosesus angulatus]
MASSSNNLKRGCSALDSENRCSACGKSFSAPHFLDRHQKKSCDATKAELSALKSQAEALDEGTKRRRIALEAERQGSAISTQGAIIGMLEVSFDDNTSLGRRALDTPTGRGSASRPHEHPNQACTAIQANHRDSENLTDRAELVDIAHPQAGPASRPASPAGSTPDNQQEDAAEDLKEEDHTTARDAFGLRRRYYPDRIPKHDPDQLKTSMDLYDSPHHRTIPESEQVNLAATPLNPPHEQTPIPPLSAGPSSQPSEASNAPAVSGSAPSPASSAPAPTLSTPAPATSKGPTPPPKASKANTPNPFDPFPNVSSFELGEWFYNQGSQKSLKDFKSLIEILTDPTFSIEDLKTTKWTRVFQDLGKNKEEISVGRSQWVDDAGWRTKDIELDVPIHNRMEKGRGMEKHVAGQLHYRSIVSIVEEKIRNAEDSRHFYYDGYELLWQPGEEKECPEFRLVSELYHSEAFLRAQREVRESPPPQIGACNLPRIVIGLSFWSDATHLSTFSISKIWPLYMLFANESKHRRTSGQNDLSNHVAYFDSLSDGFKDYITERTGGKIPPGLLPYLNREIFHAQWEVILDEDLLKAIVEGIVIECPDGVTRRFFIRIFTYSADYPEKVLIATIKSKSDCPCVHCLVHKNDLVQMGTKDDMAFRQDHPRVDTAERQQSVLAAREVIRKGMAVDGSPVEKLLTHSAVPILNAFSNRLSGTGFDIFSSLAVDMLHEYEIGVFKTFFLHLIRILEASAPGKVLSHEVDKRFRALPPFNQTIRKFSSNVSKLRRRAGRDYEDILQCAIAPFDGLLPEPVNGLILKLLYINARWHALAKLRLHSDATVFLLEDMTTQLGDSFRQFVVATSGINTVELEREVERRTKPKKKKPNSKVPEASGSANVEPTNPDTTPGKPKALPKKLNLSTPKFHTLGHYVQKIRWLGPTDLYSTEWGEYFHRSPKAWSKRTSRKFMRKEISRHERRRARLRRMKYRALLATNNPKAQELREQRLASRNPDIHHYIGPNKQSPIWLADLGPGKRFSNDILCSSFVRNLKKHLLPRFIAAINPGLTGQSLDNISQWQDWSSIALKNDRFYTHKIMRIKYTTYDARRNEDIIHLDTDQCNAMLIDPGYSYDNPNSSQHPFKYCKVIGILHAEVAYIGEMGRRGVEYPYHTMEVLWVRWYRVHPATSAFELDRAELIPVNEPESHSFIDPIQILRACHMTPRFTKGKRYKDGVGMSQLANDGLDWNEYYIDRFADRDMFMRYEWGLAVGHVYTHRDAVKANNKILLDPKRRHVQSQTTRIEARGSVTGAGQAGLGQMGVADATRPLEAVGGGGLNQANLQVEDSEEEEYDDDSSGTESRYQDSEEEKDAELYGE